MGIVIFIIFPIFVAYFAIGSGILALLITQRYKVWEEKNFQIRRNQEISKKEKEKLLKKNTHPSQLPKPVWWKILNPFV